MNTNNVDWAHIAAKWIAQHKHQQQIPEAPAPPSFHNEDAFNENHVSCDMEIEDVAENHTTFLHTQDKQQNNQDTTWHQNQQHFPFVQQQEQRFIRLASVTSQSNHHSHHSSPNSLPVAPEPPAFHPQSAIDMVLDDSDGGEDSNATTTHNSTTVIDAQKRKTLPSWIREGLEKMERLKKQEEDRILREKEILEEEEKRKQLMTEALIELEHEKSKYESESENEELEGEQKTVTTALESKPKNEDSYEKMMLQVRPMLTEIMLEGTNSIIYEISSETLSKYRKKASSVAVRARTIGGGLGLGIYTGTSDEDDSNSDENLDDHQSDWESEAILKERIRQKEYEFEQKNKEIRDISERVSELEEKRYQTKTEPESQNSKYDSDSSSDVRKFKRTKTGGEMLYSISGSSASAGMRREKKTRFSDPKDGRSSNILLTHVSMFENVKPSSSLIGPTPDLINSTPSERPRKNRDLSSSSSSSDSSRRKKHKHKKSSKSKHSKRSRSRDRKQKRDKHAYKKHREHKSDRNSIESSKSSARSSELKCDRSRSPHSRHRRGSRRSRY